MSEKEKFRQAAAECLLLAETTTDIRTKAKLVAMAQRWLDMAVDTGSERFSALLDDFNGRQMGPDRRK
jgi:hypothetical protein